MKLSNSDMYNFRFYRKLSDLYQLDFFFQEMMEYQAFSLTIFMTLIRTESCTSLLLRLTSRKSRLTNLWNAEWKTVR